MSSRRESFLGALVSSTLWRVLDRFTGLLKHILIAALIGLTGQLDAFYMALAILGVLVFAWAEVADVIAVPRMAEWSVRGDVEPLQRAAAGLFSLSLGLGAAMALLWWVAVPWIALLAPGFSPEQRVLLESALAWFTPVVLLYPAYRQLGGMLRAVRRFSLFYKGELLISVTVLACIFFFGGSPTVLFWSYAAGIGAGFLYLLAHAAFAFRLLAGPRRALEAVRGLLGQAPMLILLNAVTGATVLIDRVFVSFLPEGSMGALAYALIATGLAASLLRPGTSFVTVFAEAQGDPDRQGRLFDDTLILMIVTGIPVSAALLAFADPLLALAAGWGVLRAQDVGPLILATLGMGAGAMPLLLLYVLDQVFLVKKRLGTLLLRTTVGLLLNAILNALVVFVLGWGVWGIGAATAVSYWTMALLALGRVPGLGVRFDARGAIVQLVKTVLVSGAIAVAGRMLVDALPHTAWILPVLAGYVVLVATGLMLAGGRGGELAKAAVGRLGIKN